MTWPVVFVVGLGLWTAIDGLIHSTAAISGIALTGAVALTVTATRRFDPVGRSVLLGALPLIGGPLALSGWLGLLARAPGWSQEADGLWRAAGLLTYSNALAATLAMLAVLGFAHLSPAGDRDAEPVRPISPSVLCLATTLMVTVLLATLSRAGLLSLAAGLAVLARGGWPMVRGAVGPLAGGAVAFAALVPSLSAASRARPLPAAVGLVAGALAAELLRRGLSGPSALRLRARSYTPVLVGSAALALFAAVGSPLRPMLWTIVETRLGSGSSYRMPAARQALSAWADRPLDGLGTGGATTSWRDGAGAQITLRYLHNEYLQVLVEHGVVGAGLLLAAVVAGARLALAGRPALIPPLRRGGVGATAAFAVSSGFDITWHTPALPVLAASIYGAALTPSLIRRGGDGPEPDALALAGEADNRKDHEP